MIDAWRGRCCRGQRAWANGWEAYAAEGGRGVKIELRDFRRHPCRTRELAAVPLYAGLLEDKATRRAQALALPSDNQTALRLDQTPA